MLLTVTAALTAAVMPAVFARLPIDPAAVGGAAGRVAPAAARPRPSAGAQWVIALVPTNAIRAAADGAIVPLLVFSVAFALGASRIRRALREPLVTFFRAVDAAITVLLHWIVALARRTASSRSASVSRCASAAASSRRARVLHRRVVGALVAVTAALYLVV